MSCRSEHNLQTAQIAAYFSEADPRNSCRFRLSCVRRWTKCLNSPVHARNRLGASAGLRVSGHHLTCSIISDQKTRATHARHMPRVKEKEPSSKSDPARSITCQFGLWKWRRSCQQVQRYRPSTRDVAPRAILRGA